MVARAHDEKQEAPTTAALNAEEAILAARKAAFNIAETGKVEKDERGFTRVFDKKVLVGKPFVIVDWEDNVEEYGWTATVRVVQGSKALFFKDTSTGIRQQLLALREKGIDTMIQCPRGLRVSEYQNPFGDGMSKTYYLDDSAV